MRSRKINQIRYWNRRVKRKRILMISNSNRILMISNSNRILMISNKK